jgi:hypothetical protein
MRLFTAVAAGILLAYGAIVLIERAVEPAGVIYHAPIDDAD